MRDLVGAEHGRKPQLSKTVMRRKEGAREAGGMYRRNAEHKYTNELDLVLRFSFFGSPLFLPFGN